MIADRAARAIVIADGPSLTEADVAACRGAGFVLAISDAHRLAPWADALYSCDATWWRVHKGCPEFEGLRFASQPVWEFEIPRLPDAGALGDHSAFRTQGGNSGYQGLLYAARRAWEVVLLGFDCQDGPGGRKHWHGKHPAPLRNPGPANYSRWIGYFDRVAPALAAIGVAVVNCSPATALTCFRRATLAEALSGPVAVGPVAAGPVAVGPVAVESVADAER